MWSTVNKLAVKISPANANPNIAADKFNSYFAFTSNSSTILNPHIRYQHHTILIISHRPLYIIFLIKVALKKQDLMVFQAGFSNLFLLQSVSPC